jgi:hypothetical protein
MSQQDLKFTKNYFAGLDYTAMSNYWNIIESIIENAKDPKKIEDFYLPGRKGVFVHSQIDKKIGLINIRPDNKFHIQSLKKDQIELWKILGDQIKDIMNKKEYQILDALRKNGLILSTVYDEDEYPEITTDYPYVYHAHEITYFIKFVIHVLEERFNQLPQWFRNQIGNGICLRFDGNFNPKKKTKINYKEYCESRRITDYCWIGFNSYELYHIFLMYVINEPPLEPHSLQIYSSNGVIFLNYQNYQDGKELTENFLFKLPSLVVNYEKLIKIDQDRIKKRAQRKKSDTHKKRQQLQVPAIAKLMQQAQADYGAAEWERELEAQAFQAKKENARKRQQLQVPAVADLMKYAQSAAQKRQIRRS